MGNRKSFKYLFSRQAEDYVKKINYRGILGSSNSFYKSDFDRLVKASKMEEPDSENE